MKKLLIILFIFVEINSFSQKLNDCYNYNNVHNQDYTSSQVAFIPMIGTYAYLEINGNNMTEAQRGRTFIIGAVITTTTFFTIEFIKRKKHHKKKQYLYY